MSYTTKENRIIYYITSPELSTSRKQVIISEKTCVAMYLYIHACNTITQIIVIYIYKKRSQLFIDDEFSVMNYYESSEVYKIIIYSRNQLLRNNQLLRKYTPIHRWLKTVYIYIYMMQIAMCLSHKDSTNNE